MVTATSFKPATDKQLALICKLATERDWVNAPCWDAIMDMSSGDASDKVYSTREASAAIDALFDSPKIAQPVSASSEPVTDGMYLMSGVVYKVQIAKQGSGNLYAKRLTENGFEYAPGIVRKLSVSNRMTLEEAKQYGALYGVCCVCARDLTDENSIAAGIGPVCAGKF